MSANLCNLFLENILQPAVVATIVLLSFVARAKPFDYACVFVYFSTLYAFWVGVFGSCQAVNTELRNGEWSYWILGMGRNRFVHLCALCVSCLVFALLQIVVFGLTIYMFKWVGALGLGCGISQVYENFVGLFSQSDITVDKGSCLFQMQGLLRFVLAHDFQTAGVELFAFCIFGCALVAATVSGVGFGLLFSVLFRDPIVSLNISVGFVVVLGMVSYCGLKGTNDTCEKNLLAYGFAPKLLQLNRPATLFVEPNGTSVDLLQRLVQISRVLPQRYFYNIGSVTFYRHVPAYPGDCEKRNDYDAILKAMYTPWLVDEIFWMRKAAENKRLITKPIFQGLVESISDKVRDNVPVWDALTNNVEVAFNSPESERQKNLESAFYRIMNADPNLRSRLRLEAGYSLIVSCIVAEIVSVFWLFVFCIVLSAILIYKKESFHVLR